MHFYNAYNEQGEKTLVYVGVNAAGADMLSVTAVNTKGQLDVQKGIVADKSIIRGDEDAKWWEF
jgi:hypothetical protein